MASPPELRYTTSDGVSIAYQVGPTNGPDLVYVSGWVSNLALMWDNPYMSSFIERLSSFSRLITFDKRGVGLSDRVSLDELPTLEQRMDDVRAVLDAVDSELERGDVVAGGVGDERGVPEPFDGVEQRQLGARVGAFTAHDQPGAGGPGVEVHELGELGDLGAVTMLAVGVDRWVPAAGRHADDAVADAFVDAVAEAELDVPLDAFLRQPVRSPS